MDSRLRRASDGLLSAVKEASSDPLHSGGHRSPLLTYKTEPGARIDNFTLKLGFIVKETLKFFNTCFFLFHRSFFYLCN